MKTIFLIIVAISSVSAFAISPPYCVLVQGEFPVGEGTVERVDVNLSRINGLLYRGYTVLFTPAVGTGKAFAKVWGPGRNPKDPNADSAILSCDL